MKNKWSDKEAVNFIKKYSQGLSKDLALRIYTSRLIGSERKLVMHGGGNTSVKTDYTNILGETMPAIFIKASGYDMSFIGPEGFTGLDLGYLKRLRELSDLSDEDMINEFRTHMFNYMAATPSLETLVHSFIPEKFIDHTHPDAILTLSNLSDAREFIIEALGENIIILEYIKPGFGLSKAVARAFDKKPGAEAMVLLNHGLLTWGENAHVSYKKTIKIVSRAEKYIAKKSTKKLKTMGPISITAARKRFTRLAPLIRGLLKEKSDDPDRPYHQVILKPLINKNILDFINSDHGKEFSLTPPLTTDYLIRTKPFPLWINHPDYSNIEKFKKQIANAIETYAREYKAYIKRNSKDIKAGLSVFDPLPRVILMPGLGAICAGKDVYGAKIVTDITEQALSVKSSIAKMGAYRGLDEKDLLAWSIAPTSMQSFKTMDPP